jgi:hypothetical protein
MTLEINDTTLFKVLNDDGSCFHGGQGGWYLPNGRAGKWMPKLDEELAPCAYGYHVLRASQLVQWLGPAIFTVEYKGEMLEQSDKLVVGRARLLAKVTTWNERTARLFAADCAEHVLHFFEDEYPDEKRPREAIQASRDYANGLIRDAAGAADRSAAWAAAGAAARDAAWAAAWTAARAAARAAAGAAARDAAWAAAWAAARDAAGAAARAAAGAAARDAAGAAARAAAWDAARAASGAAARAAAWAAARDAARAAAGAAAGAADRSAAWDAEQKWQTDRLMEYLRGDVE